MAPSNDASVGEPGNAPEHLARGVDPGEHHRDLGTASIGDYIESFYNCARRHSHAGYLSPIEFELGSQTKASGIVTLCTAAGKIKGNEQARRDYKKAVLSRQQKTAREQRTTVACSDGLRISDAEFALRQ